MDDVPQDILSKIKHEIESINSETPKSNEHLVGNIKKEFKLSESIQCLEPYVLNLMGQYDNAFHYLKSVNCLDRDLPFELDDLWVNLQSKHEFNPNHNHVGVMSFVIWIDIPFLMNEELKQSPGIYSTHNCSGHFEFSYTNVLGDIWQIGIPADKTYEGKILMFPNKMIHCVYPFFSSDDNRISVAGNIRLKSRT